LVSPKPIKKSQILFGRPRNEEGPIRKRPRAIEIKEVRIKSLFGMI
jgi:hypothetical protein